MHKYLHILISNQNRDKIKAMAQKVVFWSCAGGMACFAVYVAAIHTVKKAIDPKYNRR